MIDWLQLNFVALLNVIVIDVVLAGDNAIIVGLAASRVAPEQRSRVIFWGVIGAVGELQRLGDHHPQHRAGEVDLLVAAVDRDLALAGLDPDAGDGVLPLAGRVCAALGVNLALVDDDVLGLRAQALEGVEAGGFGGGVFRHLSYALRTFLAFRPANAMVSGF